MGRKDIKVTSGKRLRNRRRVGFTVSFVIIGVLVTSVFTYNNRGPKPPGDELKLPSPYGWQTSKDVGAKFTDGLNLVTVTPHGRGPLRLISARPVMDSGKSVLVIGTLARINPDMLPPNVEAGSFQEGIGFPPTQPHAAGAVPIEGLIVQPPGRGENRWIELQIGYEVVAPGRSVRRGIELEYEYGGSRHIAFIPSHVAYCAPATVECKPEYDN